MEASNLVLQVREVVRLREGAEEGHRSLHAVTALGDDLADLPARTRSWSSCIARLCLDMRPTPTLMPAFSEASARASMRRLLGPSTVTGFSMKTWRPFLSA